MSKFNVTLKIGGNWTNGITYIQQATIIVDGRTLEEVEAKAITMYCEDIIKQYGDTNSLDMIYNHIDKTTDATCNTCNKCGCEWSITARARRMKKDESYTYARNYTGVRHYYNGLYNGYTTENICYIALSPEYNKTQTTETTEATAQTTEAKQTTEETGQLTETTAQHTETTAQHTETTAQHTETTAQHAEETGQLTETTAQHAETTAQHAEETGQLTETKTTGATPPPTEATGKEVTGVTILEYRTYNNGNKVIIKHRYFYNADEIIDNYHATDPSYICKYRGLMFGKDENDYYVSEFHYEEQYL